MPLNERVALVTGGGSGIGKATAKLFAKEGAKVAVLGHTQEKLDKTVKEIQDRDGEAIAICADISQAKEMQGAIAQIIKQWNRLDIIFANAGINGVWSPLEELDPDEWQKTINVNLTGTYLTVKYAVPYLKKQGGSIIITSSVNGTRMFSNSGATAYACTKAAQVAFTKMIALELAEYQVRVNVICPGAIETDIESSTDKQDMDEVGKPAQYPEGSIPLTGGKPGSSHQVAQLVLFLASDASSHITGTEMWIDGGQSLLMG